MNHTHAVPIRIYSKWAWIIQLIKSFPLAALPLPLSLCPSLFYVTVSVRVIVCLPVQFLHLFVFPSGCQCIWNCKANWWCSVGDICSKYSQLMLYIFSTYPLKWVYLLLNSSYSNILIFICANQFGCVNSCPFLVCPRKYAMRIYFK